MDGCLVSSEADRQRVIHCLKAAIKRRASEVVDAGAVERRTEQIYGVDSEKDIIGKTDVEIFSGVGVKEPQDFKREVRERGLPAKREITFKTELFEESMQVKQMLATMSHEIRSPLSGVVSMAEILSTTNLDKEQKKLLKVMLSFGDLVLQLINDILDLSKVESGIQECLSFCDLKCLAPFQACCKLASNSADSSPDIPGSHE
ncbi:histidine kinase 5 [Phtheirospermum japonicum]|uniref:histidine kinase n=1 Tax=Phtheirospermum japonicum TaxID=374723 RepID=A0A830BYN5_9LAMI|nr:histidine kinase 5 [Phtheirospermum japonicum]